MMKQYISIFLSVALLFTACKKDHHNPSATNATKIYVLGSNGDTSKYWVNGVATNITKGWGNSLFVSGTDVYVAGAADSAAAYWKNGTQVILQDSGLYAYANSIYVSGTDVYVAGIEYYPIKKTVLYTGPGGNYPKAGYVATYWKNGTANFLSTGLLSRLGYPNGYGLYSYNDYISSIFVSGTDIYVAGGSHTYVQHTPGSIHFARYWKNGVSNDLVNGLVDTIWPIISYPTVSSLYVSGSDVYLAGNMNGDSAGALYWKNGISTFLSVSGMTNPVASSIFVSGSDVYVAGSANTNAGTIQAIYWKNGVPTSLPNPYGAAQPSSANSIFVSGNDVYVAGFSLNPSIIGAAGNYDIATYWKNGAPVVLHNGTNATSICVR